MSVVSHATGWAMGVGISTLEAYSSSRSSPLRGIGATGTLDHSSESE